MNLLWSSVMGFQKGAAWKGKRGRTPGVPNKSAGALREAAGVYSTQAIEALVRVMRDDTAPAMARIAACKEILDRACGKPRQEVEVTPFEERSLEELTDAELTAIIRAAREAEGSGELN
jgi:hypothetical protein